MTVLVFEAFGASRGEYTMRTDPAQLCCKLCAIDIMLESKP